MKKKDKETIHLRPIPHDSLKAKHPDCEQCKQLPETQAEAKIRIANQLKLEIEAYQKQGLPNEIIALRIYASLVDSRLDIEGLKAEIDKLVLQLISLNKVLDAEIKDMLINGSKTSKSG